MTNFKNSNPKEILRNTEIVDKIKTHLQDVLKPIPAELKEIINDPIQNPIDGGGLKQSYEKIAKELQIEELVELSQHHKEEARVKIQAVLKIAYLFSKSKTKENLTEKEKIALKTGIAVKIDGQIDHIKTVKKGGTLQTEEFKEMAKKLYKAIEPNQRYAQVLRIAASYQKKEEEKEKLQNNPSI